MSDRLKPLILIVLTGAFAGFLSAAGAEQNTRALMDSSDDCYVDLFDGDHFKSSHIRVQGPAKYADLKSLPGSKDKNWNDEADSLKVGAGATVTAWQKTGFKGGLNRYPAGSEHPDIDEPSALEIECD